MANRQANSPLGQLRRLLTPAQGRAVPDEQLLRRFLGQRDEVAFAALVERHGPMVLGVCRSVLRHVQDAEDACQATFLVLARKAASVRKPGSLASFLHGVAYRLALKAKAARRPANALTASDLLSPSPMVELTWRGLRQVLHEELGRLPEKYRLPLVLCYLEGRTQEEAAQQLGWSAGVLKGRLDRGREHLRRRLTRRGLALTGPLLAACLSREPAGAGWVAATARSALRFLAGRELGDGASAQAGALAEGLLRRPIMARLNVGAGLVALGLLAAGAGLAVSQAWEAMRSDPVQQTAARQAGEPDLGQGQQPRADRLGDPLPIGAVARIGSVRWWHGWGVQCPLVFTPDGTRLACCEASQAIRFLDVATGKESRRIQPPGEGVTAFALAPDGKTLVTADLRSPVLRLWDVATGNELRQLRGDAGGTSVVAFAPDGKTLAAATPSTVIRLWDVATWQETGRLPGHTGWISSVVLLPDGKTLISGAVDGTIRCWDLGTGREVRRLRQARTVIRLCASPDGKRLANLETPTLLRLRDAATGEDVSRTVLDEERGSDGLCFSPDSCTLACSVRNGRRGNQILFFAAATGRELGRWEGDPRTSYLAFSPDGKILAQASDRIRLWDAVTGKPVGQMPGLPDLALSVAFAPDGKALVVSCWGGLTGSWDPLTGRQLGPLQPPPKTFADRAEMLLGTALTADGQRAALVDAEGVLHVWEPASGKEWCRIGQPPVGNDEAAFSPDGRLVAVKHRDNIIRVWDAETGKLRCSLPRHGENCYPHGHAFSADGRLLASAFLPPAGSGIRLWDTTTGKPVGRLAWEDNTIPTCLRFSPDGKYLVAAHGEQLDPGPRGARREPGVRLWDPATGRELRRFPTPAGEIRAMALSPDGKTVAAAAWGTVVLWELASGQERGRFTGHREWVQSLAFSPDGRLLASGSLDYTALVWDVTGLSPDGMWAPRDVGPEEVGRLWTDLCATDGARTHRALWRMVAAPRQAVPFLAGRLRPAAPVEDERLTRLIADLDSDRFDVRRRASQELQRLGEQAVPAVRRALAGKPSPEARRRLEELVSRADSRTLSAEQLHALRAVEVLEHIGTPPARRVLERLAGGAPGALLTDEATASLERLSGR